MTPRILAALFACLTCATAAHANGHDTGEARRDLRTCLSAIAEGGVQRGMADDHPGMEACVRFTETFWQFRFPEDQKRNGGWSYDTSLIASMNGMGLCAETARSIGSPDMLKGTTDALLQEWQRITAFADTGQTVLFAAGVQQFAREIGAAMNEPWEYGDLNAARVWNSRCAGFFGIPRGLVAKNEDRSEKELDHRLDGSQQILTISGLIAPGFSEALTTLIEENQFLKVLALGSVGGTDIEEAMKVGRLIRERQLFTRVVGNCESACAMLFAAGQMRSVGANYPEGGRLGFHRLIFAGTYVTENSELYDKVAAYYRDMGVDPKQVIGFMTYNPGAEMYYPSVEDLCAADVLGIAVPMRMESRSMCEFTGFLRRMR